MADCCNEFEKHVHNGHDLGHEHEHKHKHGHSSGSEGHDAHAGHSAHAGHNPESFKRLFWINAVLAVPVLLFSPFIQGLLGISVSFNYSNYFPAIFGSVIFFYGGSIFLRGAWQEISGRLPGMMTLISIAIITAYAYSIASTFFIAGIEFFWELSTLVVIMLLGHWLEMRAVANAQGALRELAKLLPDRAELVSGVIVDLTALKVGDEVLVRPGAKIPADGVVLDGKSEINEAIVTGESGFISKSAGSRVIAGTVNSPSGALKMRVEQVGEKTFLSGVMRLVAEAQASKSRAQLLADRIAFYLTIVAVLSAAIAFSAWLVFGQTLNYALERAVTILVIACPHALGLAIPLVTSISTTLGARNGILVKKRIALEAARNIDVVVFDKTGTLTVGEPGVAEAFPLAEISRRELVALAAAAESRSEHPVGRAIVAYAEAEKISFPESENFRSLSGKGVEAEVSGKKILVGGLNLLKDMNADLQVAEQKIGAGTKEYGTEGYTSAYIFSNGALIGIITLADLIRPESASAVHALQSAGYDVALITGDSEKVAGAVARALGIKTFFAGVLPGQKAEKIKELQSSGRKVAMVGDGVNDAPALAQADVGIAVGAGTDVAIESAGLILTKSDPLDIPKIFALSRGTYRKMKQNIFWATAYNVIAIPLAGGILASKGILIPPALGALLMSASTIIVAFNAQLLRRLKLSAD